MTTPLQMTPTMTTDLPLPIEYLTAELVRTKGASLRFATVCYDTARGHIVILGDEGAQTDFVDYGDTIAVGDVHLIPDDARALALALLRWAHDTEAQADV